MTMGLNFSHLTDLYLEFCLCPVHQQNHIEYKLASQKQTNKQTSKPQTIHINNVYDIMQIALMLLLLVFRKLGGLWLKVHWLAHFWAFTAAGIFHTLMKEENINLSGTQQLITPHEGTTFGNYTSNQKKIIQNPFLSLFWGVGDVGMKLLCTQENSRCEDWWKMHQKEMNNVVAPPFHFIFPPKERFIIARIPQIFQNCFSTCPALCFSWCGPCSVFRKGLDGEFVAK